MRIGQDNLDMTPFPRRPLFIQDQNPSNCKIYITDMHPYHPNWESFVRGDKWDKPTSWYMYKKAGDPTNPKAIGGHSDALSKVRRRRAGSIKRTAAFGRPSFFQGPGFAS